MAEVIKMPRLSDTMEEGVVSQWLKKVGDKVSEGDILAEIETDKATMEVETVDEGFIEKLLYKEGDINIPVNKPIALISMEKNSLTENIEQNINAVSYTHLTLPTKRIV